MRFVHVALVASFVTACSAGSDPVSESGAPPPGTSSDSTGPDASGPSTSTPAPNPTPGPTPTPDPNPSPSPSDAGPDASHPPPDSGTKPPPPATDSGSSSDGPPTRQQCTPNFGSALSSSHARLDGYLVSIIPPGQDKQCNGDSTHVHLQVQMQGSIYDVAVNADGYEAELDAPLAGGSWSEGWHTQDGLDYPNDLGAHSAAFTTTGLSTVAAEVEQRLANANHVAIFCTGYGPTGCHLVHRNSGSDGAIVIDPLSPTAHWLLFDFSGDTF
jgi:hypothetical protein